MCKKGMITTNVERLWCIRKKNVKKVVINIQNKLSWDEEYGSEFISISFSHAAGIVSHIWKHKFEQLTKNIYSITPNVYFLFYP